MSHAHRPAQPIEQTRRLRDGEVADIHAENLTVQELERLVRLFEGPKRILLALREVIEEADDFRRSHLTRMTLFVKENETSTPLGEALARLGSTELGQG